MEDDAPVIYGLEFQARSLTAQIAETDSIKFFVGTQSLRFENQIHHIDFDDENNIINKTVFLHKDGEIWHISSSPFDKDLLGTVYNKTSDAKAEMCAAIWRVPEESDTSLDDNMASAQSLELLTRLEADDNRDMKNIMWHPSGEDTNIITLADNQILVWDLNASDSSAKMTSSAALEGRAQPRFTSGRWNPHHNSTQIATANDTVIRGWDLRSMKQVFSIENAHGQLVRDMDFNPNKQYYMASCGDDCKTKFWDIRDPSKPLKVMSDHSHWVWSVRYNHFHDQLVLTSSSDSRVTLTNLTSLSSEPFGNMVDDDDLDGDDDDIRDKNREPMQDGVIYTYEEHEDSVYAAEWSTADPWLFASLSFDGRLVINRVPRATKYRILL